MLKNDRALPAFAGTSNGRSDRSDLPTNVIALLGNYYGTPSSPVTIRRVFALPVSPKTKVLYSAGPILHRDAKTAGRARHRVGVSAARARLRCARTERRVLPRARFSGRQC